MYIYIYRYTYTHRRTYIYTYMYIHIIYIHTYTCIYIYICVLVYCKCIYIHINVYVDVDVVKCLRSEGLLCLRQGLMRDMARSSGHLSSACVCRPQFGGVPDEWVLGLWSSRSMRARPTRSLTMHGLCPAGQRQQLLSSPTAAPQPLPTNSI